MSDSYKIYASQDYVDSKGLPEGTSANQQLVTDKDGVVKWEEKPFFHSEYGEDITWDGDTTDREIFVVEQFSFYKVSDTIYTRDKMVGMQCTIMINGTEIDAVITDTTIFAPYPECPDLYFVMINNIAAFFFGPAYESLGFSGGVFFINDNGSIYTNYLSGSIVKRIDPFYIPLIPADKLPSSLFSKVQKTFEGSFDKVTEGRDTFIFDAYSYYKFSEFAPRREDVISFSGTRADGEVSSPIAEGENCCEYGFFIVVYQAGQCTLESIRFNAPSAGLYACYESGNDYQTAGTYNFTYRAVRHMIQSSTTFKRYYLDVDDSGIPTFTDTSDSTNTWTPTDELPTVTSEDAGKFLRVSSAGTWVAESIPNAEGVSF